MLYTNEYHLTNWMLVRVLYAYEVEYIFKSI